MDSDSDLQAYINQLSKKTKLLQWEEDVDTDEISTPSKSSPEPVSKNADIKAKEKKLQVTKGDHKIRFLEEKYLKKNLPISSSKDDSTSLSFHESDLSLYTKNKGSNVKDIVGNVHDINLLKESVAKDDILSNSNLSIPLHKETKRLSFSNDVQENIFNSTSYFRRDSIFSTPREIEASRKSSKFSKSDSSLEQEIPEVIGRDVFSQSSKSSNQEAVPSDSDSTYHEISRIGRSRRRSGSVKTSSHSKLDKSNKKSKEKEKYSITEKNIHKPPKQFKNREKTRRKKKKSIDSSESSSSESSSSDSSESIDSSSIIKSKRKRKKRDKEKEFTKLLLKVMCKKFPHMMSITAQPYPIHVPKKVPDHVSFGADSIDWKVNSSRIDDALRQTVALTRQFLDTHQQYVEAYCPFKDPEFRYTVINPKENR